MQNTIEIHVPYYYNCKDGGIDLQCEGFTRNGFIDLTEEFAHFKPGEFELDADKSCRIKIDEDACKKALANLKRTNNRILKDYLLDPIKGVKICTME